MQLLHAGLRRVPASSCHVSCHVATVAHREGLGWREVIAGAAHGMEGCCWRRADEVASATTGAHGDGERWWCVDEVASGVHCEGRATAAVVDTLCRLRVHVVEASVG